MENDQRPIVQTCYINGKICRNGKRSDFASDPISGEKYGCNKWVKLVGKDPQTGTTIDTWCCNEFANTKLALEANQSVRQGTASTDKVANQIARHRAEFLGALPAESQARLLEALPIVATEALTPPAQPKGTPGNEPEP